MPKTEQRSATKSALLGASSTPRPPFRADIEGIRGIAVLLVVLYHAAVPGFAGGYVGVDVFFVLSGYLITWLLVREIEREGALDLPRFYARRVRRLLPAMLVLLVAVTAFAFVFYAPYVQRGIAATSLSTAAYVSNFYFILNATDYLAGAAEHNPLLHTWSLSVEEQFYFVWPLLVLFALGGFRSGSLSRRRLLWVMGTVAVGSFALTLYFHETLRAHWAFFSSPTRAWEFAIGGLGVLLPLGQHRRGTVKRAVMGWIGLVGIVGAGMLYSATTPFPGWYALLPTVGTVLVLRAGMEADGSPREGTALARLLGWRPLQEMGRLSYSWYLWHWPVLVFAAGLAYTEIHELSWAYRAALVALSYGLAEASYRFVENPIRHNRWAAVRSRRGLALGATLTFVGIGLAFGWRSLATHLDATAESQVKYDHVRTNEVPVGACGADILESHLEECSFGDPESDTTVVLIGDSQATRLLVPVREVAERNGWHLVLFSKAGCPTVFAPKYLDLIKRDYTECMAWQQEVVDALARLRPTLTVSHYHHKQPYSEDAWREGLTSFFEAAATHSDQVLHVSGVPYPGFDALSCLKQAAWRPGWMADRDCSFDVSRSVREDVRDWEAQAAMAYANITVTDVDEGVCERRDCAVERDEIVVFTDSHHLSQSALEAMTPLVERELHQALAVSR